MSDVETEGEGAAGFGRAAAPTATPPAAAPAAAPTATEGDRVESTDTANGFNADARAAQRREYIVTIGERQFVRRRYNGNLARELGVFDAADDKRGEEARRKLEETGESDAGAADIEYMYRRVQLLLEPKDGGESPSIEFLDEHLELDDATALNNALMTLTRKDGAKGEAPAPAAT